MRNLIVQSLTTCRFCIPLRYRNVKHLFGNLWCPLVMSLMTKGVAELLVSGKQIDLIGTYLLESSWFGFSLLTYAFKTSTKMFADSLHKQTPFAIIISQGSFEISKWENRNLGVVSASCHEIGPLQKGQQCFDSSNVVFHCT